MNSFQQYGPSSNSRLFGFSYKTDELEQIQKISPVPPNMDDGVTVAAGGLYGYAVDLDQTAGRDYELIRRYRCMALHPEIDTAIENIVNEAIVASDVGSLVSLNVDELEYETELKRKILNEFDHIYNKFKFQFSKEA